MQKNGWKIILVLCLIALSIYLVYPLNKKINLGLDLKGGIHLTLQVMSDVTVGMTTDQAIAQLKSLFQEASIKFEAIEKPANNQILLKGNFYENEKKIKDILDEHFLDWNVNFSTNAVSLSLKPNIERYIKEQAVNTALETISNRVDEFGVAEPVIQKSGLEEDRILIQLPGVSDPERVKNLIQSTAILEWKEVVEGPFPSEEEAFKKYNNQLPDDLEVLKTNPRRMDKEYYVLKKAAVVTGNELKSAKRSRDEMGALAVGFSLNSRGASKFEQFTSKNIGKRLAIVLDGKIESVATVRAVISYDGIIQGKYTPQEVDDLILVLKSGSLPAPLKYLEERYIGPSLGADSIRRGFRAALLGLILVMIFMLFYYKKSGINSIIALILNMLFILAALAYLKATLTLPGIAGIVLTIGMAVDANVLIFERIKEEMRLGKSPKNSIEQGFKKAFWTIFDSNLTTAAAAIFLFQFGTGTVKGFAVTLIIGIISSMFTAVFVSRLIFNLTYGKRRIEKLSI